MRCRRCRKEISGIGKPAIPPVVPALIAIAGSIWGLFNLTLGQDPVNALPHWSPVYGWGAVLGSLALASVLTWIGLVRRKCPDCRSTQMLDGMEEEGLVASERLAAEKAAVDAALAGIGKKSPEETARELRAQIESELRSLHAKETADKLAAQDKELRTTIEQELRARLPRELQPQVEHQLRPIIEKELRAEYEKQKASAPGVAGSSEPTGSPPALAAGQPAAGPGPKPLPASTTPPPIKALASTTLLAGSRPVTPPPITTAKAIASSTAPRPSPRPVTPPPVTTAKAIASSAAPPAATPTPVLHPVPKMATPAPSAVTKTSQPAAPQAKVETAPLSLLSGRANVRLPGTSVPTQPASPGTGAAVATGSSAHPEPAKTAQEAGAATEAGEPAASQAVSDGHERARRRARVILSDLSLYHGEVLLKAARAEDAKLELGTLWRDAIISYNEAVPPDIRSATDYLEEELRRQLAELRQA